VIFYDDYFYIISNKRKSKLGYYLVKIPENDPVVHAGDKEKKEEMFLMNY